MKISLALRLLIFGLVTLIGINVATAFAATNTVPATNAAHQTLFVDVNDLKPSACMGWTLTNLVTGSGTLTGSAGNDLILGGPGSDVIDGLGGDDCILGGGGADQITGGDGSDVCIGGPDNDTFIACEGESQ